MQQASAPMQQKTVSAQQEKIVNRSTGMGSFSHNTESNKFGNYGLRGVNNHESQPQQSNRQVETPIDNRHTSPSIPKTFDANKFKSLFSRKN